MAPALEIKTSSASTRRAAVAAAVGAALPLAVAPPPADAILTPLALILKGQSNRAKECYEQGECAEPVPYYAIECEREDAECLARRRRLASRELASGDLGGAAGIAALLLIGPAAAVVRVASSLIRRSGGGGPPQ